jgi:hypothetical protein
MRNINNAEGCAQTTGRVRPFLTRMCACRLGRTLVEPEHVLVGRDRLRRALGPALVFGGFSATKSKKRGFKQQKHRDWVFHSFNDN